jgi:predicted DNA-binding transcriptional regulator AlpA
MHRRFAVYLNSTEAAKFTCLSRARVEQLLRDPKSKFPRPYQPGGRMARRAFKQSELVAWMETQRAEYPVAA